MLNTICRFAFVGAAAVLGATLISPAAEAATPGHNAALGKNDVVLQNLTLGAEEEKAVRAYWTAERIAAVSADPPSDKPPLDKPDGTAWNRDDATGRTVGRLFFTERGEDSSCTATVVASTNRSAVVTGGHCVVTSNLIGEDLQWMKNVLFVPGFQDGQAPYGRFVVRAGVVHRKWLENDGTDAASSTYDQAFLVLGRNEKGTRVADAVSGAQQIAFDQPGGRRVYEFGYPRASTDPARQGRPEYAGRRLAACYGVPKEDPGLPGWPSPEGIWGVPCVMGGGASGGPRISGLSATGYGTVIGVNTESASIDDKGNSCEIDTCTRHLVGPQFTTAVTKPLYKRAATY